MYLYVATINEIEAIFSPPQGCLKRNEIEHHKVIYFDFLLIHVCTESQIYSGLLDAKNSRYNTNRRNISPLFIVWE